MKKRERQTSTSKVLKMADCGTPVKYCLVSDCVSDASQKPQTLATESNESARHGCGSCNSMGGGSPQVQNKNGPCSSFLQTVLPDSVVLASGSVLHDLCLIF